MQQHTISQPTPTPTQTANRFLLAGFIVGVNAASDALELNDESISRMWNYDLGRKRDETFDIFDPDMINQKDSFKDFYEELDTFCKVEDFPGIVEYCRSRPQLRHALLDILRKAVAFIDPNKKLVREISRYNDPEFNETYIDFRFICDRYDPLFEDRIDNFYLENHAAFSRLDGWIQISSDFVS